MNRLIAVMCLFSIAVLFASIGYSADSTVSQTSSNDVLQAMKRIIIPEIEFKQAPIKEVVDFLVKAALTNDHEKIGVNILLLGSAEAACTNLDASFQTPGVTFSARYITLYNALKIMTSALGLKFHIKDKAVVVMEKDDLDGEPIIMRMYPVDLTFYTRDIISTGSTNKQPDCIFDMKPAFEAMGVSWPRGSSINYNPGIGKVIVGNTEENLRKFESLLSEINVIPLQIQITAQFVRLDSTNITHASLGGSSVDEILAFCTNGPAKLIAAPMVIIRSGEASCIKGVTEVIYPTEYEFDTDSNTNEAKTVEDVEVAPSAFSTREVGVILDVSPTISQSGECVDLVVKGSITEEPTWSDYGHDVPMGNQGSKYVPMEQPFFHVEGFESKLTIRDGHSLLAAGGVPTKDGKAFVYCVITARIVGTDGKPVRKF